jgi:Flp pilus assembly protein TadD
MTSVAAVEASSILEAGRTLMEKEIGRTLGLGPDDLRAGLDIARNLLDRGAPAKAMRIYAALVIVEPKVADYQIGLANCAIELSEYYVAVQAAAAAILLEPENPRAYFLSGRACLALGEYKEAREDLSDALALASRAGDSLVVREAERLLRSLDGKAA